MYVKGSAIAFKPVNSGLMAPFLTLLARGREPEEVQSGPREGENRKDASVASMDWAVARLNLDVRHAAYFVEVADLQDHAV